MKGAGPSTQGIWQPKNEHREASGATATIAEPPSLTSSPPASSDLQARPSQEVPAPPPLLLWVGPEFAFPAAPRGAETAQRSLRVQTLELHLCVRSQGLKGRVEPVAARRAFA